MYGKLIDGSLVYAPKNIVCNNVKYIPAKTEVLVAAGWKEIIHTPMPGEAPELYRYSSSWIDGEKITQTWSLVEYTNAEKVDYYKQRLLDTDKYFIQNADGGSTEEEYAAMKVQRQDWRDKIDELENDNG